MRSRLTVVLAVITGSFFLYCGQGAAENIFAQLDGGPGAGPGSSGGFVKDAHAEPGSGGCCAVPPQTFTKLKEGKLGFELNTPPVFTSGAIDVGAYREVVVYARTKNVTCPLSALHVRFRPDASTPFADTGASGFTMTAGGRLRVDGSHLELSTDGCAGTIDYAVAGVSN
jgi:hypothetical protein